MPDSAEEHVSCRICMDPKDSYVSLFSHNLSMKVMEVADVQVEKDDGLPSSICTECEQDLEKCYEFRLKVQVSDKKLRENIKLTQVDIVECNIKEERYMDDGDSDNLEDKDSGSMDDEHYDDEPDVAPRISEETEEAEPDPLNHVVVVEENERKMEMTEEPSTQDDMVEEPQVQKIEEVALDPLVCMKQEAETEIMDVDSNMPDPFGPSSSVKWTGTSQKLSMLISTYSKCERFANKNRNQQPPSLSEPHSGQVELKRIQQSFSEGSQSGTHFSSSNDTFTKSVQSFDTLLPGQLTLLSNNTRIVTSPIQRGVSAKSQQIKAAEDKQRIRLKGKTANKTTTKSIGNENLNVTTVSSSEMEKVMEENVNFCSICNVDCGTLELLHKHKSRKDFICRACTAHFVDHSELETHFQSHKKYTCGFCKKVFYVKSDFCEHKTKASLCNQKRVRIWKCEYCNKTFIYRRNLNQHIKLDHYANPDENFCHICKSGFRNHSNYTAHMKSIHNAYEGMECKVCDKIVLGPTRLKYHIKMNHILTTERCPVCKKVFASKSIKSHLDTHDQTETVCSLCGTTVKNKCALKRHLKTHLTNTENKIFNCNLCNKKFNTLRERRKHKKEHKTHQPVFCDICGKQYKSMEVLKIHLKIHSDDKPFVCDICGAAFKQRTVLQTHTRIHSDDRKYNCPHCYEGFRWKQTFDKHVAKCESNDNDTNTVSERD